MVLYIRLLVGNFWLTNLRILVQQKVSKERPVITSSVSFVIKAIEPKHDMFYFAPIYSKILNTRLVRDD